MDKINGDDPNPRSGATWSVIALQMHETIFCNKKHCSTKTKKKQSKNSIYIKILVRKV
jgi:hypothetical protein